MKNLRELQRYVSIQHRDERDDEVRAFMSENAELVAGLFGVPVTTITNAVATLPDDADLVRKTLNTIKSKIEKAREAKKDAKVSTAQASATALGSVAFWIDEAVHFDLQSLLASCLTNGKEWLVFQGADGFEVAICMEQLLKLARLDREDQTAFVDRQGMHVRWREGRGQLNFCHRINPQGERVTFPLPPRDAIACAAE